MVPNGERAGKGGAIGLLQGQGLALGGGLLGVVRADLPQQRRAWLGGQAEFLAELVQVQDRVERRDPGSASREEVGDLAVLGRRVGDWRVLTLVYPLAEVKSAQPRFQSSVAARMPISLAERFRAS
jgi:hypothetical protein